MINIIGTNGVAFGAANSYPAYDAQPPTGIEYANTYISAANITNATQQQALRTFEARIKPAGILSDVSRAACLDFAIWPIIGGTSQQHSFNFIDPARSSLGFNGSPTHDAGGVDFNGQGQYAATDINPFTDITGGGVSMSMYTRSISGGQYHMGAYSGGGRYLTIYQQQGQFLAGIFNDEVNVAQGSNLLGWRLINRINTTQASIWLRDSAPLRFALPANAPPNSPILVGGLGNNGAPGSFAAIQVSFVAIGRGYTDAQAAVMGAAVTEMQTTLNRAV